MKILAYREGRNLAKLTWVISVTSVEEWRSIEVCDELGHPCVSSRGPLPFSSDQSLSWERCTDETKACLDSACGALIEDPWKNGWKYKNTTVSLMHLRHTWNPIYIFFLSILFSPLPSIFGSNKIWSLSFSFLSHVLGKSRPWMEAALEGKWSSCLYTQKSMSMATSC